MFWKALSEIMLIIIITCEDFENGAVHFVNMKHTVTRRNKGDRPSSMIQCIKNLVFCVVF